MSRALDLLQVSPEAQSILLRLASAAAPTGSETVEEALEGLRMAAGADLIVVLRECDARSLEYTYSVPESDLAPLLTMPSICEDAFASGNAEFISDYEQWPKRNRILTHWGTGSAAVLPAVSKAGRACILVLWRNRVEFDEGRKRLLLSMLSYFAAVLPHEYLSKRLAITQERLESILATIPQGIVLINFRDGEAWVNVPASEMIGVAPGDLMPVDVSNAMTALQGRAHRVIRRTPVGQPNPDWVWIFGDPAGRVIEISTRHLQSSPASQLWVMTDTTANHLQSEALRHKGDELAGVNKELMEVKAELEVRVRERTDELAEAVANLTERNLAFEASEERLRLAVDVTALGIFDTNLATGEGRWDTRCRAAFGIPQEMAIDLNTVLGRIHPDDRGRVDRAIDAAAANDSSGRYDMEYRTVGLSDGAIRHVHVVGQVHHSPAGPRIVGTMQEITARKRAEDSLLRANSALRDFAYAAAHDLQEPLRNVSNALGLLKKSIDVELSERSKEMLEESLEGARRMHNMVKDLLQFTKISESDTAPAKAVDPNAVLDNVRLNLATSMEETGAQILAGTLPKVRIDEIHLMQLFQNLISNSIKYRDAKRTPVIRVSAAEITGEWLFKLEDNGIGFESQYAERIFGIFKRLHGRSEYSGNGIGLAICARIIALYGGRIWAESQLGAGAQFYFTLPR